MLSKSVLIVCMLCFVSCTHHSSIVAKGADFTVYQNQNVRVYIAAPFSLVAQSQKEANEIYVSTLQDLGSLLHIGVLTGEMFYEALGNQPTDPGIHNVFQRTLTRADDLIASESGPVVKILNYEDLSDPKDFSHRKYDIWLTFDPHETGWGAFHHFMLELENPEIRAAAGPNDFAKHARVASLRYDGMEQ